MMATGYGLLVPDRELTVADAAEILGVSEDTVRALIRSEQREPGSGLPAIQRRTRGAYYLQEADVQAVKDKRAAGLLAGPVDIDPVELALLVADEAEARALRAKVKVAENRRNNRAREIRSASGSGYGAVTDMATAVDLHRTVVQRWLREAVDEQRTADLDASAAAAQVAYEQALQSVARARAARRIADEDVPDDK